MRRRHPFFVTTCSALTATLAAVGATAAAPERPKGCEKPSSVDSDTTYTRCVAKPSSGGDAYCLPGPNGETLDDTATPVLPATLTVESDSGHGSVGTAVDIRVKNCRTKTQTITGEFALLIDNSMSICWDPGSAKGTDCSAKRVSELAKPILEKLYAKAASANSVKVGILGYGGRQGATLNTTVDDTKYHFNPDFTKWACFNTSETDANGHNSHVAYSGVARTDDYWTTPNDGGSYYSVCEFLSPRAKAAQSDQDLLEDFLDLAATHPRGATDMTYFFDGARNSTLLGSAGSDASATGWARTALMITDGLPNIPRRIPKSVCKNSSVLMESLTDNDGEFYEDATTGAQYCIDRQFKYAAELANDYLEGNIDFANKSLATPDPRRFAAINLHNILYVGDGLAYSDVDWRDPDTTLYPNNFLVESSARTGNGKIKFHYLYGSGAERDAKINSLIEETVVNYFDTHAVQRVTVTLSKGGTNIVYNAVSANIFGDDFGIKLVGLEDGTYTAKIDTYYSDKMVSKTVTVTVGGTASSGVTCSEKDANKTVDGSNPNKPSKYVPGEDGVLPYPNTSNGNQCRVYRNDDDSNDLSSDEFYEPRYSDNGLSLRAQASKLRIQGGTGNCGNIVAASSSTSVAALLTFLPLLGALIMRRRKP